MEIVNRNLKAENWRSAKGFTLIETMIYLVIISSFLATVVFFGVKIVESSDRARVQSEVQQNLRVGMERMVREIRTADNLNAGSSIFGSSPGILSITHDTAGNDPTIFDLSGGALRITQGLNGPYNLTSDDVTVTNLVFTNLSRGTRTEIVRIEMTVEYVNQVGTQYSVSTSATTSVLIREEGD